MSMKFSNRMGDIKITSRFVSEIAAKVTETCYGVVGMASRNKADGIVNLLRGDNKSKGIKVDFSDNKAVIELHIVVEFGLNITSTCKSIAQRVRYTLENVTGIPVKSVNIRVEGIRVSE